MAKKKDKVVEIYIPSELGYEKIPMAAAATVAQRMGFSPDRIEDLKTAIGEAVTNAIEHGNQSNVGIKVLVELTVQDKSLTLNVVDKGKKPIPEIADVDETFENRPGYPRGLGMFLIRRLVDEMVVSAKPGRNEVRMVIHLEPKSG
ncbi:MAG: anti-sigma regulatory factor [Chloroflexota bacterium]|nr:MAG: anti-sigma regulatory factor [Chloroflexota bacterium]